MIPTPGGVGAPRRSIERRGWWVTSQHRPRQSGRCNVNDANKRRLAVYHLARARAGAGNYNRDLVLELWPDVPLNGDTPTELVTWLNARPDLLAEVLRVDTETPPKAEGWQVYTLADAYAPRPPVQYVVAGLFPLPSLSIVYGAPGCFKTMLMGDMAAAVAAGLDWLPPLPDKDENTARATLKVPVLWCDFDNGPRTMHERIEAAGRARDLPPETPLFYVSMPTPWFDASDFESVQYLADFAHRLGAKLIVIDNLRDIAGGVEENSAQMGDVMSNLRRLAEDTQAALVLIHHQRKMSGTAGRAGDTLRGHSSIEASLDLALKIEREEHADTVQLSATKSRGADVLPFGAVFSYEWRAGTTELAEVRFFGLQVEDLTSDQAIRRAILEAAKTTPDLNKGDLAGAVKEWLPDVGINRIRSAIDYLASEGKLAMTQADRGAKQYRLPEVRDHLDVTIID